MALDAVDTRQITGGGPWRLASFAFALVIAVGLSYFLVRMPLQVSDSVANMMGAEVRTAREILASEFGGGGTYFRPLLEFGINAAFEIGRASGRYFLTFKAIQVAQVIALLMLFTRLLRVDSVRDFSAASVAIVAVVGMHTFFSTVYELYPINTYMTILICCVLALVLSDGRRALWRDVASVALFVFALFTLETGVLVWVIALVGLAVGFRGVSMPAVALQTAALIAYVLIKFSILDNELPGLDERSASFGFGSYNQQELVAMFSDRRLTFYGANILSSIVTIFFAEPRAGLWRFLRTIVRGEDMPFAMLLNVITSTASTLLIVWFVWTRRRAWRRFSFDRNDRFVAVFFAVVVVNGVMSFPYTKDAIVSPAGVLFPLVLFVALREMLQRLERARAYPAIIVGSGALLLLSLGWTLRAAALPYGLMRTAFYYQQEWVHIDDWIVDQGLTHYDAEQRGIIGGLRSEALSMEVPNIRVVGGWMKWAERAFDRP